MDGTKRVMKIGKFLRLFHETTEKEEIPFVISKCLQPTWKTITNANLAARTAQKSFEMSYLFSDQGGSL